MKSILFLSVFAMSLQAYALDKQIWSKDNDHYFMSYEASSGILISENCFNENVTLEKSKCLAAQILKKKKSFAAPKGAATGGKNPGAVICKVLLNNNILVLKDRKENENAFCVFDDASMISAISLESLLKD